MTEHGFFLLCTYIDVKARASAMQAIGKSVSPEVYKQMSQLESRIEKELLNRGESPGAS